MQESVASEAEGIDLIAASGRMDEADILVGHRRFDLERAVGGHHRHEGLGRRHDAAQRVYRQLLHHAVDRGGQGLKLQALSALTSSWRRPAAFSSSSASSVRCEREFRLGLVPLFGDCEQGRLGLGKRSF